MYTEQNLSTLSGPALVEAYNGLKPEKEVKRFSNRDTGIKRVLALQAERAGEVTDLGGEPMPPKSTPSRSKQAPVRSKPAGETTRRKRFDEPYLGFTKPCREGTKRATIVELLSSGATFEKCMQATGWNQRTCYDGIKLVHKDLGYGLSEGEDGIITLVTK